MGILLLNLYCLGAVALEEVQLRPLVVLVVLVVLGAVAVAVEKTEAPVAVAVMAQCSSGLGN
jgi:hypothetical protein